MFLLFYKKNILYRTLEKATAANDSSISQNLNVVSKLIQNNLFCFALLAAEKYSETVKAVFTTMGNIVLDYGIEVTNWISIELVQRILYLTDSIEEVDNLDVILWFLGVLTDTTKSKGMVIV